jgi:hypothetical protein
MRTVHASLLNILSSLTTALVDDAPAPPTPSTTIDSTTITIDSTTTTIDEF